MNCIEYIRQMHIDHPRKYPMGLAMHAWSTLNVRRVRDLRMISDTLAIHSREDRPTYQQLHAVDMAVVNSAGCTWFRGPDISDMANPSGYFKPDVIWDLNDDVELEDWGAYHSGHRRNLARVYGPPAPVGEPEVLGFVRHL